MGGCMTVKFNFDKNNKPFRSVSLEQYEASKKPLKCELCEAGIPTRQIEVFSRIINGRSVFFQRTKI